MAPLIDMKRLDITRQNVAVEKVLANTGNPRHRHLLQAYLRHRYRYQQTLGSELVADGLDAVYLKRSQITMLWPYDDRCRLLGEEVWEYDTTDAGLFRLDPADVLTVEQARTLLDPFIKPLPAFDDTMLPS